MPLTEAPPKGDFWPNPLADPEAKPPFWALEIETPAALRWPKDSLAVPAADACPPMRVKNYELQIFLSVVCLVVHRNQNVKKKIFENNILTRLRTQ